MALTAVPDNVNGKVTIGWNNVVAQTNRIYMRQSGLAIVPPWSLVRNNIVGVQGANSIDLYDNIPIGIAMDYAITGVNSSSGAETSPNSAVISNVTIAPDYHWDTGGWNCMLHMVGLGATYKAATMIKLPLKYSVSIDAEIVKMFGNQYPSVRYGTFNYREIELKLLPRPNYNVEGNKDTPAVAVADITSMENLLTLLSAVQTQAGVICFRTTYGDIFYCALSPQRSWEHDLYQLFTLKLVQIQYSFVP